MTLLRPASLWALAVSLALPLDALARAGGGGGGGGGGGFGGVHHNSAVGVMLQGIVYAVGIPVALALWWWRRKRTRDKAAATDAAMKRMSAGDANWDEELLRPFVETSFLQIQQAWCAQDLDALGARLGPELLADWAAKIQGYRRRGVRNVMDGLRIRSIRFVEAEDRPGSSDDRFTAEIAASAADYALDASGSVCRLDPGDERANTAQAVENFTEYWTYRRSGGVWILERVDQDSDWRRSVNAAIVEEDAGR